MRMGRDWPLVAALAMMVACVLAMNLFCLPAQDEIAYAFGGMGVEHRGIARAETLGEVICQQCRDYVSAGGNGRVWLHGIVTLLSAFRLNVLGDVLNTVAWFVLVWLVLREGMGRPPSLRGYLLGGAVLWWLLWYAEVCSMNLAYTVNYLWMACATVCMMALWRQWRSWWLAPIAFLFGWSQETFVLPFLAATLGVFAVRSVLERRFAWSLRQCLVWGMMAAGACCLCFGPAASARAGRLLGDTFVSHVLRGQASVALYPWIAAVAVALVVLLFRRETWRAFLADAEWWFFTFAGYGLYSLAQEEGSMHMLYAPLLGGVVLLVRRALRTGGGNYRRFACGLVVVTLGWMAGAAMTQVWIGWDVMRMLRTYRHDPQGITWRPARNVFPFLFAVDVGPNSAENYDRFRLLCGGQAPMTLLPPWLYHTLYRNPTAFFSLPDTQWDGGGWRNTRLPGLRIVSMPAESLPSVTNPTATPTPSTGWRSPQTRAWLPGRFQGKLFPDDDYFVNLPNLPLTFVAADGSAYAIQADEADDVGAER